MVVRFDQVIDDQAARLLAYATGAPRGQRIERYPEGRSRLAAAYVGARMVGVMGFDRDGDRVVLRHIAVDGDVRHRGTGRSMVTALRAHYPSLAVVAETDSESVGFYRALGFDVRSLGEKYPGVERFAVTERGRFRRL
ncbi:GNAT family N-acetyltransferase [Rhodococcus sp. NPDC057297]|uniref:GNAT family N-acetyltransferase n=1 Tax=Rhodococcus sp. NPDC057297 TaxID=3346090 RepID=UPI00364411B2